MLRRSECFLKTETGRSTSVKRRMVFMLPHLNFIIVFESSGATGTTLARLANCKMERSGLGGRVLLGERNGRVQRAPAVDPSCLGCNRRTYDDHSSQYS